MSIFASDNLVAEKDGQVWFVWVQDEDGNPIALGCDIVKQKAIFKAGIDFARKNAKTDKEYAQ